jgi:hypothetical protein
MGKALAGLDEPLLDVVSLARRGPNGRLSPEEISLVVRTLRRTPEVMVKVSGGARSTAGALAHLKYIDRHGDLGERGRSLLDAGERRWILKGDFAMLRPAESCGAVRECLALAVQDFPTTTDADDRCVARGSVGLLASFDCRHDGARGDMTFLVSFTSPRQTLNSPEWPRIP